MRKKEKIKEYDHHGGVKMIVVENLFYNLYSKKLKKYKNKFKNYKMKNNKNVVYDYTSIPLLKFDAKHRCNFDW